MNTICKKIQKKITSVLISKKLGKICWRFCFCLFWLN